MSSIKETTRNASQPFSKFWGRKRFSRDGFNIRGPIALAIERNAVLSLTNTLAVLALNPHVVEWTNSQISFKTSKRSFGTKSFQQEGHYKSPTFSVLRGLYGRDELLV